MPVELLGVLNSNLLIKKEAGLPRRTAQPAALTNLRSSLHVWSEASHHLIHIGFLCYQPGYQAFCHYADDLDIARSEPCNANKSVIARGNTIVGHETVFSKCLLIILNALFRFRWYLKSLLQWYY